MLSEGKRSDMDFYQFDENGVLLSSRIFRMDISASSRDFHQQTDDPACWLAEDTVHYLCYYA
jgi:hypothetical protein